MKEQQKRKIQQFHPEIEDGIDLRRCPQDRKYFEKENILSIEENKQYLLLFLVSQVLLNQKEACVIHLSVPLAICHLLLS